jgi:hypothetical protein
MEKVFSEQGIVFEGDAKSNKHFTLPSEDEEDHPDYDPYGQLGYGFEAYFSSLQIFAWVFLLISVIMLPAFCYYDHYGGLKSASHGYYNSAWMLGNMGFNKAVCISDYVELHDPRIIGCEVGLMSEIIFAGIVPNTANYEDSDMPYGYCGNAAESGITNMDTCTTYIDESIYTTFKDDCAGKDQCEFTMTDHVK